MTQRWGVIADDVTGACDVAAELRELGLEVSVMLADRPGELGRLFGEVGATEVNLEDVRIEHVLGRPSGLVVLFVKPDVRARLAATLTAHDFDVRL